MQIQVNTDKNIEGDESLITAVTDTVKRHLDRFSDQITRVEVHLTDQNSASKSGATDIRCLLETRLAGRDPNSVSDNAESVDRAVNNAAQKMVRSLETTLGKLNKR